jgi:hypothetical protein
LVNTMELNVAMLRKGTNATQMADVIKKSRVSLAPSVKLLPLLMTITPERRSILSWTLEQKPEPARFTEKI